MEQTTRRIAVLTRDRFLGQKLCLELMESLSDAVAVSADPEDARGAFAVFCDVDTVTPPAHPRLIRLSSVPEKGVLPLPLPFGAASDALRKIGSAARLVLDAPSHTAFLDGAAIRLSDLEFALLALLVSRGGETVSREEILATLWHEEATPSVLNVYIHYLREKLESGGAHVLVSSRGSGYAVDARLLGEEKPIC